MSNNIRSAVRRYCRTAVRGGLLLASLPCCFRSSAQATAAELPLISPIFGDNMVVQRDKPETLWGWSEPGDVIHIAFAGKTATATAQPNGRWQTTITPPAAGGPYSMTVTGRRTAELQNILVGDVWLCSGQSNMEFMLRQVENAPEVLKAANDPQIRFFTEAAHASYHTAATPKGSWKVVTPDTADRLSAVAYYFARRVQQDIHVPIGLVVAAVGGTPAEAWTSEAAIRQLNDFEPELALLREFQASGGPEYGNFIMHWYDRYDVGLKGGWSEPSFDDAAWKAVTLPGGFAELGVPNAPAVAYFRRKVTLPDPVPAGRSMLMLGVVERMDTVWVNGKEVGGSSWVENPRAYFMPPGVLKPGENEVVIRVLKTKPDGGFLSKPEDLRIDLADGKQIPLAGEWKGRVSVDARPPHPMPVSYENWPVIPSVLYEGMVAPLAPLSITGALWYQGEQNSEHGYEYRKVLPAMIADWRRTFAQGDFPFYVVSLPAFKKPSPEPTDDAWAETREAQALTVATVSHTCLAVTIDTGEADNIHPKKKEPVGDRLARCALAEHYGKAVVDQGPTLTSAEPRGSSLELHFAHADGGLVLHPAASGAFQIAGDDHKWVWGNAQVVRDSVIISSPFVKQPTQVRYAWQANPKAVLFNGAGLPAGPFRTDSWQEMTQGRPAF